MTNKLYYKYTTTSHKTYTNYLKLPGKLLPLERFNKNKGI